MSQQPSSLGGQPKSGLTQRFSSFDAFFPFYLSEHSHIVCRRLHFFGSLGALASLIKFAQTAQTQWLLFALLSGYGLAWLGHFLYEKNRPASFKQPLYSFLGDWKMFWMLLSGKLRF